jgi:cysteinyl-tRNA synthetase
MAILDLKQIPIYFYNSLSREKELFKPIHDREVRMYTCGPTVYHYVHIGNLRTFVFEDLLRRTLKFFGFRVQQVMNLTDVDDKTIRGALSQKVSLDTFTQKYKDAFFEDLKTLLVQPVEHYPAATDYIVPMIQMVEALLKKGMAYKGKDGSIYYPIAKFPQYGSLSHLKIEELKAGASERVAADEYDKESIADFVLWKAYDQERDGSIFWESPFGPGRPGWHIECSAMSMKLLGETLDIHVGGIDNMFPHHENEIAQSEAYTGKKFVNLWMHAEHLIVEGKKMSKSLGNFYTLRDLLNLGYTGIEIRYMLLHTHYKTQLNFTVSGLAAIKSSLQRLQDFIYRLHTYSEPGKEGSLQLHLTKAWHQFAHGLADDLNISQSLAALFDLVREVNILMDQRQLSEKEAKEVLEALQKWNEVLAILDFSFLSPAIPTEVQALFDQRMDARKGKNWALADSLRNQIVSKGYIIEDSPTGARLKKS